MGHFIQAKTKGSPPKNKLHQKLIDQAVAGCERDRHTRLAKLLDAARARNFGIDINDLLIVASRKGSLACMEHLLSAGANPNSVRGDRRDQNHVFDMGVTPLGAACIYGRWKAVLLLLKAGANPSKPVSKFGLTPLFHAAWGAWWRYEPTADRKSYGDEDDFCKCIKYLVSYGADVNAHIRDGSTPLWMSVRGGSGIKVTELFLASGANPNGGKESTTDGTPLMAAIESWEEECGRYSFNLLLDYGADLMARDHGALRLAIKEHNTEAVIAIVRAYGAKPVPISLLDDIESMFKNLKATTVEMNQKYLTG